MVVPHDPQPETDIDDFFERAEALGVDEDTVVDLYRIARGEGGAAGSAIGWRDSEAAAAWGRFTWNGRRSGPSSGCGRRAWSTSAPPRTSSTAYGPVTLPSTTCPRRCRLVSDRDGDEVQRPAPSRPAWCRWSRSAWPTSSAANHRCRACSCLVVSGRPAVRRSPSPPPGRDRAFVGSRSGGRRRHGVAAPRRAAGRPRGVEIEDLGSSNGTTLNGNHIIGSLLLRDGDLLGLGSATFLVKRVARRIPQGRRATEGSLAVGGCECQPSWLRLALVPIEC